MRWILSKLFPPTEPIYHVYRRQTKLIPVMTGSQARAYLYHLAPDALETMNEKIEEAESEVR